MKLLWAANKTETVYGYGFLIHSKKLREAIEAAGVKVTLDPTDTFDLAVHVQRPDYFEPVPGKKNVLFTQTEFAAPLVWGNQNQFADCLVTSCKSSAQTMARLYKGPVEVCPLGVDTELFPFFQRQAPGPGERFTFLWLGSRDNRKGSAQIMRTWNEWGDRPKNARLWMKFNGGEPDGSVGSGDSYFVVDNRNLTGKEIAELYNSAHAFLFCSLGEAWGLPLTEAMATGLPAIWTAWSAMLDYGDSTVGYPVSDFHASPIWLRGEKRTGRPPRCHGMEVNPGAVTKYIQEIMADYPAALARGKRASERMHSCYTWAQSAQRFVAICERVMSMPTVPAEVQGARPLAAALHA